MYNFFIWLHIRTMKKLLTLTALVAGVALFAGCMDKPAVEDETLVEETPVVEEVVTDEVVPTETTTTETTTEVTPEATAE